MRRLLDFGFVGLEAKGGSSSSLLLIGFFFACSSALIRSRFFLSMLSSSMDGTDFLMLPVRFEKDLDLPIADISEELSFDFFLLCPFFLSFFFFFRELEEESLSLWGFWLSSLC